MSQLRMPMSTRFKAVRKGLSNPTFSRDAVRSQCFVPSVVFALLLAFNITSSLDAQTTINISNSQDLVDAIIAVNAQPSTNYTLNFNNGFAIGQTLPSFNTNSAVTLSGNSKTLDAANNYQPLVINNGAVTLQNLNIINPGQPTTINGGTLIDKTGSLQGPVTNNSALKFNEAQNTAFNGIISGTGSVEVSGTSFTTLSGKNTYTGGTTIDPNSTLIGTTDSIQGPIKDQYLLVFSQSKAGTFSSLISGTGAVEVNGAGAVTLTGLNTYSGGNYISSNSTLIGTTDSIHGPVQNYGTLTLNQTFAASFAGPIVGSGGVVIGGTAGPTTVPITFTGANTYSGGTMINAGFQLVGTTTSIQGPIINNGIVQFNQSGSGTFADDMTGNGSVQITSGSTITFTGSDTYTGSTFIDGTSSLTGTTSNLQGSITTNGSLHFNQSAIGFFNGQISGGGNVEISGSGPITFLHQNSYTGGTTIDAGSSLIGNSASLQGNIANNGLLTFNQTTGGTYSGNITGTGSVQISNGALTLKGTNSYAGGTTVDKGSTVIGSTLSINRNYLNNGLVKFVDGPPPSATVLTESPIVRIDPVPADSASSAVIVGGGPAPGSPNNSYGVYDGVMNGTGSVEIAGKNPIYFLGSGSYVGGTTVDGGATLFGRTYSLQGNITNNGLVIFNNGSFTFPGGQSGISVSGGDFSGTYAGNMSGTGSVEIQGGSSITFAGVNSYTGGTAIDHGSTLIGTTASLQGSIYNNGSLIFNEPLPGGGAPTSHAGLYSGNISGTGSVEISSPLPVIFTGTNTYTGGTTIDKGSMLTGTTFSVQGSVVNNGMVQFSQPFAGTYAGVISGTGGVSISGAGAGTVATSDSQTSSTSSALQPGPVTFSGVNTYTGGTSIGNGGILSIASGGSILGPVSVNNGGTLMGQGSVGATTVNAGGTIAPGSPGAPLTVKGNFTQGTGSTYTAELNPTHGDKIAVTGTAQVNAGTTLNLVIDSGTYSVGSKYQILSAAGGLTGNYTSVTPSNFSQNIVFSQQYNPNDLTLVVKSNLFNGAITSNQMAIASLIDQTSGSALGNYTNALTQLTLLGPGQLNGALNQISGDIYPSISTIERQTSTVQMQLLSSRLAALTGPGAGPPGVAQRTTNIRFVSTQGTESESQNSAIAAQGWTTWAQGYGLGGNVAGDGNAGSLSYQLGGTLFGVERWIGENTMVGVLGGYTGTSIGNNQASSKAQISAYQAGLYELHRQESLYISNIDALINSSYDVTRPINIGPLQQTANGKSDGNQWAHYTEAGKTFEFDDLRFQPFLGVQYLYLDQRGYSESGAGSLDLNTGHQIVNSVRNGFGARLFHETMWGSILFVPSISARYQHEWGNGTQVVTSSVSGAPTAQFVTSGTHTGRDFGLFTLGATAYLSDRFSLYGTIDAQAASNFYALIGSGGIRYSW